MEGWIISLVNKQVIHESFGEGKVVNYNDSHIKIHFEEGDKRFVFPDAFKKYLTLIDEGAAKLVREKIEVKEKERKEEALRLEKERALQQEEEERLEREKALKDRRINSRSQSVFWCKLEEQDEVFEEWRVFTGSIKSGENKGQPRRLASINQNSGCLLTARDSDLPEENRRILGVFMVDETFDGRDPEDGYIPAHPKYRIRLSEEESEKMLFWNYYINTRYPDSIGWNSGRQRYFDNEWMAQILRDIIALKEDPEEQEYVKEFFEYFCRINGINKDHLPKPEGALVGI